MFAYTRDQLADELAQHVFFCWDAYAQVEPDTLTVTAQQLRDAFLDRFKEIVNAP